MSFIFLICHLSSTLYCELHKDRNLGQFCLNESPVPGHLVGPQLVWVEWMKLLGSFSKYHACTLLLVSTFSSSPCVKGMATSQFSHFLVTLFLETLSSLGFPASFLASWFIISSPLHGLFLYLHLWDWVSPRFHRLFPALLYLLPRWARPHPHVIYHLEAHDSCSSSSDASLELQILICSYLPSDSPLNLKT